VPAFFDSIFFAPIAYQGRFASTGGSQAMPEFESAVLYLRFQNGKMTRAT
jgi:hypothetical protein